MASSGGDAREAQDYVRWCEVLRTEDVGEEETARGVSAAVAATTAILQSGNEARQDASQVAGLSTGLSNVQDAAADGLSPVFDRWLQSCEILCQAAFAARSGAQVAANLGQHYPNMCAQWLTSLKNLASAAFLASNAVLQQGKVPPASLMLALDNVWPELGGIGGLNASRWRTRVAAAELAVFLVVNDANLSARSKAAPAIAGLGFLTESRHSHEELLERLVFVTAITASELSQVKLAAINGASAIITSTFQQLSGDFYGELLGGLLATYMDPVPEVCKAGCEAVRNLLLLSLPDGRQDAVVKLVDKFIKTSLLKPVATLGDKTSRGKRSDGLSWLADAVNAVIDLLLLPGPPFLDWTKEYGIHVDRLPLLLVATAAAFEEAEQLKNRASAAKLENLIRSMGKPFYQASILAMLNSKLGAPSGALVASLYKDSSILDEDEAGYLRAIPRVTVVRAVRLALSGPVTVADATVYDSSCHNNLLPIASTRPTLTIDMELATLWHIVEVLRIPPELTKTGHMENSEAIAEEFIDCAKSLVHVADFLLEGGSALKVRVGDTGTLVQDLLLAFAALASGEGEKQVEVFWTSRDLQHDATKALRTLSKAFEWASPSFPSKSGNANVGNGDIGEVAGLISTLLPAMLPMIKETIKSSSSFGTDDSIYITSEGGDVSSSIVAAHQLAWFLKQVKHPHLGIHSRIVMPCALTALDHYSPVVKKQAMAIFIHLAENLDPSELQWYGDVTLDAVCRSLIGCEELWGMAIQMTVKLVTCIEGQNPRGVWYKRTLVEMLDELERHLDDQGRRIAWLKTIKPQLEAMGLVLVAHFKQLLPLIYGWLHAPDDISCILALGVLKTIITRTWCRMPFHANRIWKELSSVYREAEKRKSSTEVQADVRESCRLLCLCGGPEFKAWQKCRDDPLLRPLVLFLEQAIGPVLEPLDESGT